MSTRLLNTSGIASVWIGMTPAAGSSAIKNTHTKWETSKKKRTKHTLFTALMSPNKQALAEELVNQLQCWFGLVSFPFGVYNLCFACSFFRSLSGLQVSLGTQPPAVTALSESKRMVHRCSPGESLWVQGIFFFRIWKITQGQKDNGKARTMWPSVSAALRKYCCPQHGAVMETRRGQKQSY